MKNEIEEKERYYTQNGKHNETIYKGPCNELPK